MPAFIGFRIEVMGEIIDWHFLSTLPMDVRSLRLPNVEIFVHCDRSRAMCRGISCKRVLWVHV